MNIPPEYPDELKKPAYELFIAGIGVLSIINVLIYYILKDEAINFVVIFMNSFISVIFLADFLYRLFSASSKSRYFIRQYGWADLLSCTPYMPFKLLRIIRMVRTRQMAQKLGYQSFMRQSIANRGQSTILSLLLLIILFLEFGATFILTVEIDQPAGNIKTASDAIWYTFVTIATVGYGDRYPVSLEGRIVGMFIMLAGVSLFSAFAGYLANVFVRPQERKASSSTSEENIVKIQGQMDELKELVERQNKTLADLDERIRLLDKPTRTEGVQNQVEPGSNLK